MPRLLTFGCSHVYGNGLPDCFIDINTPGPNPSKFAWPQLLADKLGYECLNLAVPGSGNLHILMNLLRTEFKKDDLVVLGFSYFTRFNTYQIVDLEGRGQVVTVNTLSHKNLVLESLGNKYSEQKNYWDNWLAIHHCEKFLESMNIRNISFLNVPPGAQEKKPDLLKMSNFRSDLKLVTKDFGLDHAHSGLTSHRLQSEMIYNIIKEYELR